MVYAVSWSEEAKRELRQLRSFLRSQMVAAVLVLQHQAEMASRNRKRLRRDVEITSDFPEPTWEIRVGQYRILYHVDRQIVTVLRVILKGGKTLEEIL